MPALAYAHVELDSAGVPIVARTRTKIIEIALDHVAHQWSAEEIHRQHPHLSLGQIHSALAYYYDHRESLDREIQQQLSDIERLRQQAGASSVAAKLRLLG